MTQADLLEAPPAAADVLQLHPGDDVAVALTALEAGDRVAAGGAEITIAEAIPKGHKFALRRLAAGETLGKFGWPFGRFRPVARAGANSHVPMFGLLLTGV